MRVNPLISSQLAIPQLLSSINQLKTPTQLAFDSPISDLDLTDRENKQIQKQCEALEAKNPTLYPLRHKPYLLEGTWLLQYSTAREIRALSGLKWGLRVGKVYQVINLANQSFYNLALVKHTLGLISGYVLVTATFEGEKKEGLTDKRLNINFEQRYLAISELGRMNTPQLNPFKVVSARNPVGRIPTFDITYLDEQLRIGRGGDGSLYVLSKSTDILDYLP
ncbi:MAG: PAP/fibrillin family protein [Microcystaceae cyanobacterium]